MSAGAQGSALAALGSSANGAAVGKDVSCCVTAVSAPEGTTDVALALTALSAISSVAEVSGVAVFGGSGVAVTCVSVVSAPVSVDVAVGVGVGRIGHSGLGVGFHSGPGVGVSPLRGGAVRMGRPLVLPCTFTTALATHPVSLFEN
jgi:hypothetical protein